jgi:uncharacterized membrane protein
VCARDAGIYLGFVVALTVLALLYRDRPTYAAPTWVNIVLALGVAAMAIDGFTSYAGLRTTTNEIRFLTGHLTGFAIAAWLVPMLNAELWRTSGSGRVLGKPMEFGAYLVALVASYAALWYLGPLLGVLFPITATLAIIVTFVVVNLVIVSLMPPFERRVDRLRDAWLMLLIALGLTAVELAMSAWLKVWALGIALP